MSIQQNSIYSAAAAIRVSQEIFTQPVFKDQEIYTQPVFKGQEPFSKKFTHNKPLIKEREETDEDVNVP